MSTYYKVAVLVLRLAATAFIVWGALSIVLAVAMLSVSGGFTLWVVWAQPLVHVVIGILLWLLAPALAAKIARGLD